jgi:hypothetical protein
MFRVVSEFVENPFYLLICDDPRCSTLFQHPLPSEPIENPEGEALKSARAQGWLISIGRQICPGHAKQLRDIDELMKEKDRERSMIVVPRKHLVRSGL